MTDEELRHLERKARTNPMLIRAKRPELVKRARDGTPEERILVGFELYRRTNRRQIMLNGKRRQLAYEAQRQKAAPEASEPSPEATEPSPGSGNRAIPGSAIPGSGNRAARAARAVRSDTSVSDYPQARRNTRSAP